MRVTIMAAFCGDSRLLFILLICFLFFSSFSYSISYPDNHLYILEGAGLDHLDGFAAAFGDFNSDQSTDVFIVRNNSVIIYLWNTQSNSFYPAVTEIIQNCDVISNVAPTDFDHDGRLDFLVTCSSDNKSNLFLFLQYQFGILDSFPIPTIGDSVIGQVSLIDINGDMFVDLYGISRDFDGSVRNIVWLNFFSAPDHIIPALIPTFDYFIGGYTLSTPMSVSFVDFNGDCLPDIFRSVDINNTIQYEIWVQVRNFGGINYWEKSWESGANSSSILLFSDFDADGAIDFAVPVCRGKDAQNVCLGSEIHIYYNIQMPVCSSAFGGSNCRPQDNLCSADSSFTFEQINSVPSYNHKIIDLGHWSLFSDVIQINSGDINSDGFSDLLVPIFQNIDGVPVKRMGLFLSVSCSGNSRRCFHLLTDSSVVVLEQVLNAYAGGFFDFNEQGSLGLFVNVKASTSSGFSSIPIFNNLNNDALFLKATGENGVCPEYCGSSGNFNPSPEPFGVNHPGVTFKFIVNDLNSVVHSRVGAQLSQSSYLSLQTPYYFFGLGRTNDYIPNFFVGFSISSSASHFHTWVCIIPNSQLIIFPYPIDDPSLWSLDLLISPSKLVFAVGLALLCCLFILSLITFYFYMKDKKIDDEEKLKLQ